MSLVKCKECGEKVSKKTKTCPKCGISNPGRSKIKTAKKMGKGYLGLILIMLFLSLLVGLLGSNSEKKESGDHAEITSKTNIRQMQPNNEKIKISSAAYKAKIVELFKELMVLKKESVFPSIQFGLSKANPRAHDWHLRYRKFRDNTDCQMEHALDCCLPLPDGDVVWDSDLYTLATYLWKGKEKEDGNKYQKPLLNRFELAVTCYETPDADVCKIQSSVSIKSKTFGDTIITKIISVYDGDSFRANIKGHPDISGKAIGIRIYGIDTPEIRGQKNPKLKALAQKAKAFAVKRLKKGKSIILKNTRRGKYFRIVAEVWIDGVSLGEELIKADLAKPYFGKKKRPWKSKQPTP